ncbi:DUF3813 family protein [Virgibacillus soli]|uniref:DUF3813 family protein n=1 Tax=Paracerasibacillus soli TaxID=480284 RepID=UPI0035E5B7FD
MGKNLFQKAMDTVNQMTNMQGNVSEQDKQAAQDAIQAAQAECTPEEKQHLEQLQQQLEQNQSLS